MGSVLYFSDWVNADNSVPCPVSCPPIYYEQTRMDTVATSADTVAPYLGAQANSDSGGVVNIIVSPNPSENSFNFMISNLNNNSIVDLKLDDLSGRPVYQNVRTSDADGNYQLIWNAENLTSGVYLYRIKVNGKNYMGKLVRI